MFADLWKLANRLAVEKYEGFTLDSIRGVECGELMSMMMDTNTIKNTAEFLRYLVKLDPVNPGGVNVQGNSINPTIFLFSYTVVLFPEKTVWADLDSPRVSPELIAVTHQLETAAKDLVEKFEKAVLHCKKERRIDAHEVRVALVRYSRAFNNWGPVHKHATTRRVKRLLWEMHSNGVPDTNAEVQKVRRWMIQVAGQAALDAFDAAKAVSKMDALVPSVERD